jgi:hypothetical protein
MQAEVSDRPEKKNQVLGRREAAREARRKRTEKNGVYDQERKSYRRIKEYPHADVPANRSTI